MNLALIGYLPLPILHGLVAVFAYLAKVLGLSIYRSIDANLILVDPDMPQKRRRDLADQILKNQLLNTADSIKSWSMPPKWSINQITQVHDENILTEGLDNPNGMILIVPHLGAWELMNPWIHSYGKPTIMYKPLKDASINNFVLASRQRLQANLVPTDASGVKAIFKNLKAGGFSIILPDHVPDPAGGVVAPFFGIETLSGTLVPKLAIKTGCALVGLSCIRRPDGKGYEVFCYRLADENLYHKDIQVATAALNQAMQDMILPHFSHYMWGYRRFKHTPLSPNPYLLTTEDLQATARALHKRTHQPKDLSP